MPALLKTAMSRRPGQMPIEPINLTQPGGTRPVTLSRTPPEISVYIETERGSDVWAIAPEVIDWSSIERRLGADTRATLVVRALDASKLTVAGDLGAQHLDHLLELLHPDKRIWIGMARGSDPTITLFRGYVQTRGARWQKQNQGLTFTAIDEGQEVLRTDPKAQVIGRVRRLNPARPQEADELDFVTVESEAAVFNPKNKPNRLKDSVWVSAYGTNRAAYAFDDDDAKGAAHWNFAEALRYVAMQVILLGGLPVSVDDFLADTHALAGEPPATDSDNPFVRKLTARVQSVSIQSMSAEAALTALCDAAGLHYELPFRLNGTRLEQYLRVFATLDDLLDDDGTNEDRRMAAPVVRDVPRDKPFADLTGLTPADIAQRNEARQADLTQDAREINAPTFLGGAREFQVTVLLRPGWKPHVRTDPDDEVTPAQMRSQAPAKLRFFEEALGEDDGIEEVVRSDDGTTETVVYRSEFHRKHPGFQNVSDVLRRWVFPDDLSYLVTDPQAEGFLQGSPYARAGGPWKDWRLWSPFLEGDGPALLVWVDHALGGSVPEAEVAKWAPRKRPLREMIGRLNFQTTARDPQVWLNFNAPDPRTAMSTLGWVPYTGKAVIDKQRAAIWFGDDNLWTSPALRYDPDSYRSNFIEAYLEGRLAVAVTATIVGDTRLTVRPIVGGGTLTRTRGAVIDLGYEKFRHRKRLDDEFTFPMPPVDTEREFNDRDDSEALARHAFLHARTMIRNKVAGSWTAPYIKTDVRLGDSFSGCAGMGMEFSAYPSVVAIEWTKDPKGGFATTYHLSDLRHAPDVGSE